LTYWGNNKYKKNGVEAAGTVVQRQTRSETRLCPLALFIWYIGRNGEGQYRARQLSATPRNIELN